MSAVVSSPRMLGLRKRHLSSCKHHEPGEPFSRKLNCARCPYYAFGTLDGRKIRRSLETADLRDASRALERIEHDAHAPAHVTIADAIAKYLQERAGSGHRKASIQQYKCSLRKLQEFLDAHHVGHIKAVTTEVLSNFKDTWAELGDLTKKRQQQRLRTFFSWCIKRGYIKINPASALIAVKAPKGGRRERFTDAEVERIFKVIDEVYPEPELAATVRAFLLVLRYTALRIGDVCNLQKLHVTGDQVFLHAHKNDAPVYTVVPASVVDALKRIETDSEFYFDRGGAHYWSMTLLPIYQRAGVRYRSHAWRDTLVFKLLQKGTPLEMISTLLGHANTGVTWGYYSSWVPERQAQLARYVRAALDQD